MYNYRALWIRGKIAGCRWMKIMNSIKWFNLCHNFRENEAAQEKVKG